MIIFKKILAFILNIILLILIFLLCFDFLIFTADEINRDYFKINILQILFISLQYFLIIKIQNKYTENLNKSIIYSKTRFLSLILLSIMLLLSICISFELYTYAIYMFILFTILSFLSNEMKYSILIHVMCLLSIYFFQDFTVVDGSTVKSFIRNTVSFIGIKPR